MKRFYLHLVGGVSLLKVWVSSFCFCGVFALFVVGLYFLNGMTPLTSELAKWGMMLLWLTIGLNGVLLIFRFLYRFYLHLVGAGIKNVNKGIILSLIPLSLSFLFTVIYGVSIIIHPLEIARLLGIGFLLCFILGACIVFAIEQVANRGTAK